MDLQPTTSPNTQRAVSGLTCDVSSPLHPNASAQMLPGRFVPFDFAQGPPLRQLRASALRPFANL